MNGDDIVQPFDRHSNETVTLRKQVTNYDYLKRMIEFLIKFENRGIKIAQVNGFFDQI